MQSKESTLAGLSALMHGEVTKTRVDLIRMTSSHSEEGTKSLSKKPITGIIARHLAISHGIDPDGGPRAGVSWINYERQAKLIVADILCNTEFEVVKHHFMEQDETLTRGNGKETLNWLTKQKTHKPYDLNVIVHMEPHEFTKLATDVELPFE